MRHLVVIRLVELRELEEFASQQRGQLPALGLLVGEPNRNHPFTISHIPPLWFDDAERHGFDEEHDTTPKPAHCFR